MREARAATAVVTCIIFFYIILLLLFIISLCFYSLYVFMPTASALRCWLTTYHQVSASAKQHYFVQRELARSQETKPKSNNGNIVNIAVNLLSQSTFRLCFRALRKRIRRRCHAKSEVKPTEVKHWFSLLSTNFTVDWWTDWLAVKSNRLVGYFTVSLLWLLARWSTLLIGSFQMPFQHALNFICADRKYTHS